MGPLLQSSSFWLDWDPWGAGSWGHAIGAASEADPALQLTECAAGGRAWSPVVLSMWPCKNISHIQLLFTFSCNLTHTIETETAKRWETTDGKPPGRIIMIGQSETGGRSSEIVFITLFFITDFVAPFTKAKCANMQERKSFSWDKPACFDFSSSNF